MSNKTYLQDRLAWLEWLDAHELERDRLVSPHKFPCVAVIRSAELGLLGGTDGESMKINFVAYVFLDDFLPF